MEISKKYIVILGAGFSGLLAGYYLSKKGYLVSILENRKNLGGISGCFEKDGLYFENVYHFFLEHDKHIVNLIEELGLSKKIIWKKVNVGLFSFRGIKFLGYIFNRNIYYIASGADIIKNKYLTWREKMQLIPLYFEIRCEKNKNRLNGISAKEWISSLVYRDLFGKLFEPMLRARWGREYERISAGWLISRVMIRHISDFSSPFYKKVGYILGSTQKLYDCLAENISKKNCRIYENVIFKKIHMDNGRAASIDFLYNNTKHHISADCFINTLPLPVLLEVVNIPEIKNLTNYVEYQKLISMCISLKHPLTKGVQIINFNENIFFDSVTEITNIVSSEYFNGQHIIYLVKYSPDDKIFSLSDELILEKFISGLQEQFNDFRRSNVNWCKIIKEPFSKPLYSKEFLENIPEKLSVQNMLCLKFFKHLPVTDFNNLTKMVWQFVDSADQRLRID